MWFAVFYIWGTILAFSVCDICPETSEDAASWVELKPQGHCGDEEDFCPYRLTLPALSIQLPRPFRELEEMAKELQNLKEVVNQLRRDCQECKDRHSDGRGGWTDHRDEEEGRHQSLRHNISIKNTQSLDGEKVAQIFSSTLPQGDTSESEGTIKGSEKRPNHSILEVREWDINPRIDLNQGTTDRTSEMNRNVKIFNPLLDEVPEDISKVPTPVGTEKELKRSGLAEPSLPMKKDDIQFVTHVKQQPNVLRDGHSGNISDILTLRRRVQNAPDPDGLRDPNIRTSDLSTSAGNRRVLNFSGAGRPLRPRGSYINSRVVKVNNGDRLKNPAVMRKTNPQVEETMDTIQPEEAGFSPARSGIMRVKETNPHIANTKSGTIRGSSPSTDDQNKQDFSRVSGPKTDDKHVSQVTIVREDNSRNINMTEITRLPTNLRKEKQGNVSHTDTIKSFSSIMNQAEQPNTVKEEEKHIGLSESLVIISSSAVNREDLPSQEDSPTGVTPIVGRDEIKHIPQVITSNVLDNHRLKNNITEPKSQPESQNAGDFRDLDKVQEAMNRAEDNSEILLISNHENHSQDPNTMQSGTRNSPAGEKERSIISLGGANSNGQNPSEGDKISSGKKRPTASTLKKELPKKPGASLFITSTDSFTDTEHGDSTKNIHIVTNTHVETSKNLSRDTPRSFENTGPAPNVRSTVLHNNWLKNNNTESKSPSISQNAANVQDLAKLQQGKTQVRDNSEAVLIFNTENREEDTNIQQSEGSNSPTGKKERKTFSLGTADKVDKKKKGPNAPTLKKKELFKEPGTTQFTNSTVSFTDTRHRDSTKNNGSVTNAHVEMPKNVSRDTPISFESIGATKELEHIKLNKDRVDEIPGDVLSNPNTVDTANSYSGGKFAIPVVLETLTNTEEIKGSKLFSLSPEDTAEGFKSHAVSDEVTEREKAENKVHSTCLGNCNTTSTPHSQPSTSQTRTPLAYGREKGPAQDCADHITKSQRNGVYRVTPQPKNTFPVFCDMASSGGGWTLIQHRFDGSTSFNRTWDEYKNGFGKLIGEFWLGNDKIHLLTKAKNMSLRIEIEDFEGIREYAQYDHFYVANESQQYRLSIDGYSGTAGNAMQFSKKYNHDQKFFTTPDRDNDQYPSGNCGAYYSSGWWFDACMSANLNGKYYQSKYKGVRNGIFWGTWHNINMEYYPTNERQSFRTVRMMIRPKNYSN
ncbi:fibrinogen alpha chain [Danio aesculapii]|uniref:fibrinogen alpha chain n=1 Tax=Danio aesculapii TaxID=1142201 RepID=UPI0024C0769A|nr:fibrinogen alpha chain [Danio aesculapii]